MMSDNSSYTIEEVSQLLRVSKLTVYDLIKKGDLPAYRVGRQMRVDHDDIEKYKSKNKTGARNEGNLPKEQGQTARQTSQIIISGQDIALDMLSKHVENHTSFSTLRLYNGSLNSLMSMYNGECDVVSVHLYDGETGEYNTPYVKRILVSQPFIQMNLVQRQAGIYVQKGNPHQINSMKDLSKGNIKMVNREIGSGARILLDEQLKKQGIRPQSLNGYDNILTSHYSVASAVAGGQADVGIGIENVTKMVNVDFIPLIMEQYDLIILKENEKLVEAIKETVKSKEYQTQLKQFYGYDLSLSGKIIFDS